MKLARHSRKKCSARGALRAPEVHEQPDGQVHRADGVLIKQGRIALGFADDHVGRNLARRRGRIWYSALRQAPSRASTSVASMARSIVTPSIETSASPAWIPAFSPGLPGVT